MTQPPSPDHLSREKGAEMPLIKMECVITRRSLVYGLWGKLELYFFPLHLFGTILYEPTEMSS